MQMVDGVYSHGELKGIYARWYVPEPRIYRGVPAFFVDRDGVLIEEKNYLCRPEDVFFESGVEKCLLELNQAGVPVIIVTNQSGIGRGYYGWEDFIKVQKYIYDKLGNYGVRIDACVACPYHREAKGMYCHSNHFYRKPNTGMIEWAAETSGIDLYSSWIVGDKLSDLQAGKRAGLGGLAHVLTGHGEGQRAKVIEYFRDVSNAYLFENLYEAAATFLKSRDTNAVREG